MKKAWGYTLVWNDNLDYTSPDILIFSATNALIIKPSC